MKTLTRLRMAKPLGSEDYEPDFGRFAQLGGADRSDTLRPFDQEQSEGFTRNALGVDEDPTRAHRQPLRRRLLITIWIAPGPSEVEMLRVQWEQIRKEVK